MIKLAISNVGRFVQLQSVPILKRFFVFYLPAIVRIEDEALKEKLFAGLRYGDSTGKATEGDRFRDIDQDSLDLIAEPFELHDVAVSSGVTSLDLLKKLKASGKRGTFTISDKFAELSVSTAMVTRVYDSWSNLRSIYAFGILFDPRLSWWFALSKILFYPLSWLPDSGEREKILLFSAGVAAALRDRDVEYMRYDVFETRLDEKFTFVRCMNLLNLSYFGEDRILTALENMRSSLKQGGVLLLGRTIAPGTNAATFYRRQGALLTPLRESNDGTEVRHIVERLNAREPSRSASAGRE